MSKFLVRKLLHKTHLLQPARTIKKCLVGSRAQNEFKPADPRLLISTLKNLQWLAQHGHAEGSDYLEFGIFRGFNLWYAQAVAPTLGIGDMRFFGFDSFFGIPPVQGV